MLPKEIEGQAKGRRDRVSKDNYRPYSYDADTIETYYVVQVMFEFIVILLVG